MEHVLIFLLVAIFLFLFFISISVYCYYAFYDSRRKREIQGLKWQLDAATHARDHVHPKWSLVVKWVQLLEWIQNLVEGPGMSKVCNAPRLFLIYCTANLRQAEEFFTLRILSGQSTEECRDQNFICCGQDPSADTHCAYGPNWTDLTQLPFLKHYIYLYHQKFRPQLLMGMRKTFYFWLRAGLHFLHRLIPTYQRSSRNTFQ